MMIFFAFIITVLSVIVIQDIVRRRSKQWRHLSKFPGDTPLPLVGNALALGFDPDGANKRLMQMWERHGKRSFRVSAGTEEWVLLTDPDDVAVLFSDSTILSKSPERNAAVKPFFGESVSTAEGKRWQWARKLILTSFHVKSLEQRLDAVNAHSDRLLRLLNGFDDKTPVSLYKYLRPFMLDILFNTLMGVNFNFLENLDHPYIKESGKVVNIMTENFFSHWRNIRPIFVLTSSYREMMNAIETVKKTAKDIITQRKSMHKKMIDDIKYNNVNNILDDDSNVQELIMKKLAKENHVLDTFLFKTLPNGEAIPEDIINEEISFINFTGHFTVSVTISHVLYCLAKYPTIQSQVVDEQRAIFQHDFLRKPTMDDLNKMNYLDAVVKETLRVIPTVPKIGRKLHKDMTLKDGKVIPAGTTVIVFYEAMFANEKVFNEPQTFNPDRFIGTTLHPHAFLPFGGGPRNCIGFRFAGIAIKATVSNIIRHFDVNISQSVVEPEFSYRIVTESKTGVNLLFKKRY